MEQKVYRGFVESGKGRIFLLGKSETKGMFATKVISLLGEARGNHFFSIAIDGEGDTIGVAFNVKCNRVNWVVTGYYPIDNVELPIEFKGHPLAVIKFMLDIMEEQFGDKQKLS